MVSRRNVRIKVMQMLYSMNRDKSLDLTAILAQYRASISQTFDLYLFNLLLLMRTATYARIDAKRKKSKHIPTAEDLEFTPKLAESACIHSLLENQGLHRLFKRANLEDKFDKDHIRKFYTAFAETPEYKTYLQDSDTSSDTDKEILLSLYRNCLQNEVFTELVSDNFALWVDDRSLAVGAMKKTLKALPILDEDFHKNFKPDEETVDEFGKELLVQSVQQQEDLLEIITPALKNWDADRIAVIDLILIKMALIELTTFSSIPTKVTLNEYVDLAKIYSTDKSKEFINGILDRLVKQLQEEGKIQKKGRGLVEK